MGKNIFNNFKKKFGEVCVSIQFLELSRRELLNNSNIDEIIERNKIHIKKEFDSDKIEMNIFNIYILMTHSCVCDFINEVKSIINSNIVAVVSKEKKKDGEDDLLFIYRKLKIEKDFLYEVCNYYRNIRNNFIHKGEKSPAKPKKKNGEYIVLSKKIKKLEIHNSDAIDFDDFLIFSSCCLRICKKIWEKIEWNYDEIIKSNLTTLRNIIKSSNCLSTKKKLYNYIKSNYRINENYHEDEVYKKYILSEK